MVHLVRKCLENVNFYLQSDQDGSDSEGVAVGSSRGRDRVQSGMDGEHLVYRIHNDVKDGLLGGAEVGLEV